MSDYEPGTIVRADTPYAGEKCLMRRSATSSYAWTAFDGSGYAACEVTNIRPLVVIDPDDTEQVTALLRAYYLHDPESGWRPSLDMSDDMADALRSLLPTALRTVEVVTRYGGRRHLAETSLASRVTGHLFTLCRSTSAWTIDSWQITPGHPLGLTPEAMEQLPPCEDCEATAPESQSGGA